MKLTIDKATLLSMLMCQSKKDPRYYLNGVCFMPKGVVSATNGHVLARGFHSSTNKKNIIVSFGKIPTKSFHHAEVDTKSELVTLFDIHDLRVGVTTCSIIDGNYPDINRFIEEAIIGSQCLTKVIGINAEYISLVEKIAKLASRNSMKVLMKVNSAESAMIFSIGEIQLVIMPMRLNSGDK